MRFEGVVDVRVCVYVRWCMCVCWCMSVIGMVKVWDNLCESEKRKTSWKASEILVRVWGAGMVGKKLHVCGEA